MNFKEKADYCMNCINKPCTLKGCPLNNNIPEFIKRIKEEKYEEAFRVLEKTTVMPAICGRICPHMKQCEGSCIRNIKGEPVCIGDLETFVGDMAIKNKWQFVKSKDNLNRKIAIIGGGPAGLTSAAFLRKKGYDVTIFEKYNELGGILVHGIPEFRLDKMIIANSISNILNLGIKVEYGKELGRNLDLNALKSKYDAILLSIGANISSKMNIEGENLDGVYGGNELLESKQFPNFKDKIVVVNGGGNTAMDTSRTINKMGAKKVYVIYRRSREEMPAESKEIDDAIKEGIEFLFQNNIVKIQGINKVEGIECIKTKLVKKEGESRLVPINIEESNYNIKVDYVIMAVGSKPDKQLLEKTNLKLNKWGYIEKNEYNQTSDEKIFCAGDIAGGISTVAWAAKSGRDVANKIDEFLKK